MKPGAAPYDVQRVVKLSSNISEQCHHCTTRMDSIEDLAASINHYLEKHGYVVLHVGEETQHSAYTDGLWHSTVAVLGVVDPPPKVTVKD